MIRTGLLLLLCTWSLLLSAAPSMAPAVQPTVMPSLISTAAPSVIASSIVSPTIGSPNTLENMTTNPVVASVEPLGLKNTAAPKPDLKKNVLRNFIGLMVVLAVLLLLVTLYKRTHLYKNFHEQPLRIVLSLALSPKQKLAVVELFGGYSLVAISEKNVNLIQVLQPAQVMALESYLASKKPSLLAARQAKTREVSQDDKTGFENLLKKILNNPGPQV